MKSEFPKVSMTYNTTLIILTASPVYFERFKPSKSLIRPCFCESVKLRCKTNSTVRVKILYNYTSK